MHNTLLFTLLCVHVSTLMGHSQGDSYIIHKISLLWFIRMLQGTKPGGSQKSAMQFRGQTTVVIEFCTYYTRVMHGRLLASTMFSCSVDLVVYL